MQALGAALATEGLGLLAAAAFVAGLVRGFSGFGTAMVYLPVAGQVLSPFAALTTLVSMDLIGPLPNIPRALREGARGDLLWLLAGTALGLPIGVWALSQVAPEIFRYGVSVVALALLVILISGLRYRGRVTRALVGATGTLSGLLAGSVGLPGPPVILFYMASPHPARVIRATIMVFLLASDVLMLGVLGLKGLLAAPAVVLGLVLALPYMAGNVAGAAIFRPRAERLYRAVAYAIIAASAIAGLPLLD